MIGLDGYTPGFADASMAGELPAMAALRARGAYLDLDHGSAGRTGLAWEHVSTGRAPAAAQRWAAVHFDKERYTARQQSTTLQPFPAALAARTVVFDAPYFDIARAPNVQGLVSWGAHDPGVGAAARPEEIRRELIARFGPYPAERWTYGFAWPSVEHTVAMSEALVRATDVRAEAAAWLLGERLPDWDLGIVVAAELHGASEASWHGVDPAHPLAGVPSARAAGDGLRAVYRATDRLVGRLAAAFPDATLVVFNLHGMGPNNSDVPGMALLPELLLRHARGETARRSTPTRPSVPLLSANESWTDTVLTELGVRPKRRRRNWQRILRRAIGRPTSAAAPPQRRSAAEAGALMDWMPSTRYARHWPTMPAFALPSFYDGRIRVNLVGREAQGIVAPDQYEAVCDEIEELLRDCRDLVTGEPVLETIERPGAADPGALADTGCDLEVTWRGSPLGFVHPRLGTIGPLPYRRTGGHTGGLGMAIVAGEGISPGHRGLRSAFDVVPSVVEMLGEQPPAWMSGESFTGLL